MTLEASRATFSVTDIRPVSDEEMQEKKRRFRSSPEHVHMEMLDIARHPDRHPVPAQLWDHEGCKSVAIRLNNSFQKRLEPYFKKAYRMHTISSWVATPLGAVVGILLAHKAGFPGSSVSGFEKLALDLIPGSIGALAVAGPLYRKGKKLWLRTGLVGERITRRAVDKIIQERKINVGYFGHIRPY